MRGSNPARHRGPMDLRAAASLGLLLLAACGDPAPEPPALRGSYIPVDVATAGLGTRSSTSPAIIFLNRCRGGCFIEPGPEDSRQNSSSITAFPAHFPEFPGTDTVWNEFVRCMKEMYLPFEIEVTDVDPGSAPHFENIVAGIPELIGLPIPAGGVAPGSCGVLENAISYTFAALMPEDAEALCVTAAQETGHTFGLDHQMLCNDPMTYLPACGKHYFRRMDAHCGEFTPRACRCGDNYQNSYLTLLDTFGPRQRRLNLPPSVRIISPEEEGKVRPYFAINVEATDDRSVTSVRARVGGIDVGTSTISPYVFTAPEGLALGPILIWAEATDDEGLTQFATTHVELLAAEPRPDAAAPDGDDGERPKIIGVRDGGPTEQTELTPLKDPGCSCSSAGQGEPGWLAVGALGLLLLARRRWSLLLFIALFSAACGDGEGDLRTTGGTISLKPAPGTALEFEPVILTKNRARSLKLIATNTGDAPLGISEPRFSGPEALIFSVLDSPKVLNPGKSGKIWIDFRPDFAVDARATLIIESTDPKLPRAEYPVHGNSRAPCQLFLSPTRQTFAVDEEREVRVEAAGLSDCTITRLAIDSDMFPLIDPPALPFTIPAGTSVALRIKHAVRTRTPGRPNRPLLVFESDGSDARAELIGAAPIWNCVEATPNPFIPKPEGTREPQVDLTFPLTDRGFPARQRIVMRNLCKDERPQVVSVAVGIGADSFAYDGGPLPIELPPFEDVAVWVRYQPSGIFEVDYGQIHINTDDAAFPRITVGVKGTSRRSRMFVLPSMDFGTVPYRGPGLCTSRVRRVTLFNFGAARAMVNRLSLSPGSDPGFTILSVEIDGRTVDPTQPFVMAPDSAADVRIELRPRADRPSRPRAELAIESTDSNVPLLVSLEGQVVADGPAQDRFTLAPAGQGDVLFVLDDSLSAVPLRQRLRDAVPAWMSASAGFDQKLGLLEANNAWPDGGWPNQCPPLDPYLTSSTLGPVVFERGMACLLSPFEPPPRGVAGLGAAMRFFEHSLSPPDPPGSTNGAMGFLRKESRLALVMVSDEEDGSPESPALAARFFRTVRGLDRPDLLAVHNITGIDPGRCAEPFVQVGLRYQEVSRLTGGLGLDACAADQSPAFQAIVEHTRRTIDTFSLSRAATAGSLSVTVGGNAVAADALDGYSFDAAHNTVTLHGASASAVGAPVVVQYTPECQPL